MRRYVDPDQLTLEPIEGEDGWYFDTTTFTKPDGSPHNVLFMTDERGVYAPDPPNGTALPRLNGVVQRVWMTEHVRAPIKAPLGRFRDPQNRWSVQISQCDGHHKVTIEGESEHIVRIVLKRIYNGSFEEWKEKVQADARAYLGRKRRGRPSMQGHPTNRGYERPGSDQTRKMLVRANAMEGT